MARRWPGILAAVALVCTQTQGGPRTAVSVDARMNGKTVALGKGQSLEVSLEENPSTGYRWSLAGALTPVLQMSADRLDAPGGMPGRPGTRHLRYTAVGKGGGDLELVYTRSWEKDTPPARRFLLHVRVRK